MLLRRVSIGKRAALGFGLMTLILMFFGLFSLEQMSTLDRKANSIIDVWLPALNSAQRIGAYSSDIRLEARRLRTVMNPVTRDKSKQIIQDSSADFAQTVKERRAASSDSEEMTLLDSLERDLASFRSVLGTFIVALEASPRMPQQIDEVNANLAQIGPLLTQNSKHLATLNTQRANVDALETRHLYGQVQSIIWIALTVSVLVTIGLAYSLTRSILLPIRAVLTVVETIADGDLTKSIDTSGTDETAPLIKAMQRMQLNLRVTIQGIGESAAQSSCAAGDMSMIMG